MKIIVPIEAATMEGMLDRLRLAAREPADLVELRLDALEEEPDIHALLMACPRPAIVTCRPVREGGRFREDEQTRQAWLHRAVDENAAFVDIEADSIDYFRMASGRFNSPFQPSVTALSLDADRRGFAAAGAQAQLIVSMHDFKGVPDNLIDRLREMALSGALIVKFAVMANAPEDNLKVFEGIQYLRGVHRMAMGFAMGEWGEASRVLAGRYGALATFGALAKGMESAPGQPTARELAHDYRVGTLTGKTRLFAVVGDPVGHSLSPAVHNAAFRTDGEDACYVRFRVRDFPAFLHDVAEPLKLAGLSVTIPHKEAAFAAARRLAPDARRLSVANTLTRLSGDGGHDWGDDVDWQADNTDVDAALGAIRAALPPGDSLSGKAALILGAGGTARALAHGLADAGAKVAVSGRTGARADLLAVETGGRAVEWSRREAAAAEADLVANTTPTGMYPCTEETPLPGAAWARPGKIAFDAIYRPRETRFLAEARAHGADVAEGSAMFLRQAARQYELWTGRAAPLAAMEEAFSACL